MIAICDEQAVIAILANVELGRVILACQLDQRVVYSIGNRQSSAIAQSIGLIADGTAGAVEEVGNIDQVVFIESADDTRRMCAIAQCQRRRRIGIETDINRGRRQEAQAAMSFNEGAARARYYIFERRTAAIMDDDLTAIATYLKTTDRFTGQLSVATISPPRPLALTVPELLIMLAPVSITSAWLPSARIVP